VDVASARELGLSGKSIVETAMRLLNAWLWRDFVDEEMARHVTVDDPNFEPSDMLLALVGGEPRAILLAGFRRREPRECIDLHRGIAWIKVLAYDPNHREAAERLLDTFLSDIESQGFKEVRYGCFASWYLFPGVDAEYEDTLHILRSRGFEVFDRCVDYEVDMARLRVPQRVAEDESRLRREGIVFERWRGSIDALREWVRERFGYAWSYEVYMATRFDPPRVLVARRGDEVLGFACFSTLHTTWFGPIGVDERYRGAGIGRVLLFRSLREMRLLGVRIARIPWTHHLWFYAQVPGVCGIRLFYMVRKVLQP